MVEDLEVRIEQKVRVSITERILREANLAEQVATAMEAVEVPDGSV